MSDTIVFIPAWNEEASLAAVLDELSAQLPEADVLIVDDGSTDATAAVGRAHGAEVLSFGENRGLQEGIAAGYAYAEQHDEFWERLHDAERLSAAALMAVGPDGASRRARALEIFDRIPELETWTYGPEAHCDEAVRAELLA